MCLKYKILETPNLLCFWDFQDTNQSEYISKGLYNYILKEMGETFERVEDGIFGEHSVRFAPNRWMEISRENCQALDIHGTKAQVTVLAWVKREQKESDECQAIAGMWNETLKQRQYCLFLDLKIWDSSQQVCGHVSSIGGPTHGYTYCMDAAIGASKISLGEWHTMAFLYDSEYAKVYLDGKLNTRENFNPYKYSGGLFDAGENGADFTVGSVTRSGRMGNWYCGLLGGLAVFDRALTEEEISKLTHE